MSAAAAVYAAAAVIRCRLGVHRSPRADPPPRCTPQAPRRSTAAAAIHRPRISQYLRKLKMEKDNFVFEFFNEDGEMNLFYMSKNWVVWMENRSFEAPTILTFNPQNVIYEIINTDKNRIIWKNHPKLWDAWMMQRIAGEKKEDRIQKTEEEKYKKRQELQKRRQGQGSGWRRRLGEGDVGSECDKPPKSQCSENCLPGYRKVMGSSIHSCCYDCVRCSEGEISNITDSENCIQCSKSEWPNRNQDQCIPKQFEFLSYTEDVIALVLMSLSAFFTLVTALILGIFTCYRYTPIVKANNRNLSFVLLVSIMLSFLCVFLFLGRPVDITCMLRQTGFGVIFSVAVSSVLAKTIMVCIAFRATKPGSDWKKWLNVKLSNSIVVLCSSVQVIININWLAISPPFQELDMDSYHSKIVVQCNEGSVVAFYCVLGYMGLLAALSFIIAFLARTLPESFNEAKYITFSMLVFCSVWIAMIPAYVSTKGKYMVAVEIFAILTSSAGLLGCIFLPKCYIILFRPEMNTKTYLLGTSNR
ncbi:vomeronasal type-2 receptor 26-like [Spea bombifrons]|uniref:vomeronasal type-2 receptor 26-like n=1 Tax=Spea bombifrons TaxID=233779 RepID=UPI002348F139|nr:vomeronasal type-2 receptor 26-like [Spea bombifrons]